MPYRMIAKKAEFYRWSELNIWVPSSREWNLPLSKTNSSWISQWFSFEDMTDLCSCRMTRFWQHIQRSCISQEHLLPYQQVRISLDFVVIFWNARPQKRLSLIWKKPSHVIPMVLGGYLNRVLYEMKPVQFVAMTSIEILRLLYWLLRLWIVVWIFRNVCVLIKFKIMCRLFYTASGKDKVCFAGKCLNGVIIWSYDRNN